MPQCCHGYILFSLGRQTRFDYLSHGSLVVDPEVAVQLCCLEIRRYFKDLTQSALDKRSNLEYLEKEFGLRNLLPENVIASVKPKVGLFFRYLLQLSISNRLCHHCRT